MSRSIRDLIYRIFIVIHIFPSVLLALPAVVGRAKLPFWCFTALDWYNSTYNDPLPSGKSWPGGWFGGLSICEILLQLPYFFWTLTLPIGLSLCGDSDSGDPKLELPSLVYSVQATTAI